MIVVDYVKPTVSVPNSISDGTFLAYQAEDGAAVPEGAWSFVGIIDARERFPALPWHQLPARTASPGSESDHG